MPIANLSLHFCFLLDNAESDLTTNDSGYQEVKGESFEPVSKAPALTVFLNVNFAKQLHIYFRSKITRPHATTQLANIM